MIIMIYLIVSLQCEVQSAVNATTFQVSSDDKFREVYDTTDFINVSG